MRLAAALLLAAAACLGPAPAALAQAGSGAERYEVTITPPKRPGSAAAEAAPAGEVDAAGAPAEGGAASAPGAGGVDAAGAGPASGAGEQATPQAVPGVAMAAPAAKPASNLPLRTLQVGAYRHRGSAKALRDKLAASFPDVAMVEVKSGGEPLYRVNVGRLPKGKDLDDLRGRLAAAGHAAFDVEAPPLSAAH